MVRGCFVAEKPDLPAKTLPTVDLVQPARPLRVLELLLPREADDDLLHQAVARALPGRTLTTPGKVKDDERAPGGPDHLRWVLETTGDPRSEAGVIRAALGSRQARLRAHVCKHSEGLPCEPWEDL